MHLTQQTLIVILSISAVIFSVSPAMATSQQDNTIPTITIIGKRLTTQEKIILAQQKHGDKVKKMTSKRADTTNLPMLGVL